MRKMSDPPKQKEGSLIVKAESVRSILDGRKSQMRRVIKPQPRIGQGAYEQIGNGVGAAELVIRVDVDRNGRKLKGGYRCLGAENYAEQFCPYGQPGDRLWVRETHAWADVMIDNVEREDAVCVAYKADKTILRHEGSPPLKLDTYAINFEHKSLRWRPSIHMPRWASRLTLKITKIRVERLQEITNEDAIAEGLTPQRACRQSPLQNPEPCKLGTAWSAPAGRTHYPPEMAALAYRDLWDSINGVGAWDKNPWCWVLEFKRI